MIHRFYAVSILVSVAACGGTTAMPTGEDGGALSAAALIGQPCAPSIENDPSYNGAKESEVSIEERSPACGGGVCLMNHFRGRVSCPYGQDSKGIAPNGASQCAAPNDGARITGNTLDPNTLASVAAQCTDRLAANTVTCSCRCANSAGRTDDGKPYCDCAQGTVCVQLITSIGSPDDDLTGAYCIKAGTQEDRATECAATCDPKTAPCP